MAILIHLILELIRIPLLGLGYGFIVYVILSKFLKIKGIKKRFIIPIIIIGLFIWRFSYWRDNGLGDFARVPLSKNSEITMIDFYFAEIEKGNSKDNRIGISNGIKKLYRSENIIYGKTDSSYLIYNIETEKLSENLTLTEFINADGNQEKLLTPSEFHSDYWGWKILFF